jgi:radical SAM superfamily enzyme YgiQ (UPF0313 family)
MSSSRRTVLLVQLPIPPAGPQPIHANVPLAAGYLKLFARRRGLDGGACEIEILPPALANTLGDQGVVEEILTRRPWLVGFTCYVWNVERTLWIAERLKQARPDLLIVLGGPEVTPDNHWVLNHPAVDYAVIGEGEQTFAELLETLLDGRLGARGEGRGMRGEGSGFRVQGSEDRHRTSSPNPELRTPNPHLSSVIPHPLTPSPRHLVIRAPLANLDEVSSPYLEGILDAADEKVMFLETMRGCKFHCKFCYYPRGYDRVYLLSPEKIAANLRHAAQRGAREIVLLDPTLNQRPDFEGFLRLLAENNPDRQFTFFGELRAEGIDAKTAALLKAANFAEVEVGLQSLDKLTQELMGRRVNLGKFSGGMHALGDAGIRVRVDLILGLPGDTPDSFRSGIAYLHDSGLHSAAQVFNLSILPGTAFREEAGTLGLKYQSRPPYYVLQTPTLSLEDMYTLMDEAQEAFGLEYDPVPPPQLNLPEAGRGPVGFARLDLDSNLEDRPARLPPAAERAQAFTLWLRSADFHSRRQTAAKLIRQVVTDNPHTTLEVILEPTGTGILPVGGMPSRSVGMSSARHGDGDDAMPPSTGEMPMPPGRLTTEALESFLEACHPNASYLDLYYSLHPNRLLGAKRLVVLLPGEERSRPGPEWIDQVSEYATLVWRGEESEGSRPLADW